jgi:hypothetical protein
MRALWSQEADLQIPAREGAPYESDPVLDDSEDEEEEDNAASQAPFRCTR